MKQSMIVIALIGLTVTIGLIAYSGAHAIGQSLLAVGWGIAVITAFHLIPLTCSALGWQTLLRAHWRRPWWVFVHARWIREHVAHLLPVAQVGGEVVGARMLILRGLAPPLAAASVIVDLTLEALTQVVFTFLGLAVLATHTGSARLLPWLALGALIGGVAIGLFVVVQRRGLFAWLEAQLNKIGQSANWIALGQLHGLHDWVQTLYVNRRAVAAASTWHLTCWMLGTVETWLTLYFMGHSVSWLDALFLESVGEAIRGAAFFIPGQLGAQEGGYMLLVQVIGLAPEAGLTLSLIKRVRILIIGLPALIVWQITESRSLLSARRRGAKD